MSASAPDVLHGKRASLSVLESVAMELEDECNMDFVETCEI